MLEKRKSEIFIYINRNIYKEKLVYWFLFFLIEVEMKKVVMDVFLSYFKLIEMKKEGDLGKEMVEVMDVVVNLKWKVEFEFEEEEEDEWEESDGEISEVEMLQVFECDVDSFDGVEYYFFLDVQFFILFDEEEVIEDYNIIKCQFINSKVCMIFFFFFRV